MNLIITPKKLQGTVHAIPSKSEAHRLLICAAFADGSTRLICPETNQDIEATADCLRSLGAVIEKDETGYLVHPLASIPKQATLLCRESGSTLRFLLPVVGALGIDGTFQMEGRLPQRPLSPLWEEMERMGCTLTRPTETSLRCSGQLQPGKYSISGKVSSQFISGFLFAMALMNGNSNLHITDGLESRPYVSMTQNALNIFGVNTDHFAVSGSFPFHSPGQIAVGGDWSNGAFFLAANAIGNPVLVKGLDPSSAQGDRAVAELLKHMDSNSEISCKDIPDLVPILSVAAAAKKGCTFTHIQRLRLKESDRVSSIIAMLQSLGIHAEATEDTLTVFPGKFHGGIVDPVNDHRIAMAAAIASTIADGPVTLLNAQCVNKSYPSFWEEFRKLGGSYEQHIR